MGTRWRSPHRQMRTEGVPQPMHTPCHELRSSRRSLTARGHTPRRGALRGFSEATSDEGGYRFAESRGFLYRWNQEGRRDRFPLDLFQLHQVYLLRLVKLGDALRNGARNGVRDAIEASGVRRSPQCAPPGGDDDTSLY